MKVSAWTRELFQATANHVLLPSVQFPGIFPAPAGESVVAHPLVALPDLDLDLVLDDGEAGAEHPG